MFFVSMGKEGHIGPTCSPISLFHQVNIDGNAAPLALKKNAREEKSSQCASHVFRDVFVLFVWGIFGAAGCCLYCISGQPTDMSPWDPKTITLDKLMIFLSTLSKVPGRHD